MLDRLRRRQQAGIERRRVLVFLHDLLAFLDDAEDGVAGLALGRLTKRLESLLEASEVAEVVMFMLTRPRGMTIRDVVMLPTNFDL